MFVWFRIDLAACKLALHTLNASQRSLTAQLVILFTVVCNVLSTQATAKSTFIVNMFFADYELFQPLDFPQCIHGTASPGDASCLSYYELVIPYITSSSSSISTTTLTSTTTSTTTIYPLVESGEWMQYIEVACNQSDAFFQSVRSELRQSINPGLILLGLVIVSDLLEIYVTMAKAKLKSEVEDPEGPEGAVGASGANGANGANGAEGIEAPTPSGGN
jgi:hypothetical protein